MYRYVHTYRDQQLEIRIAHGRVIVKWPEIRHPEDWRTFGKCSIVLTIGEHVGGSICEMLQLYHEWVDDNHNSLNQQAIDFLEREW